MSLLRKLLYPVTELFFFLYWICWLFASVTLQSGHTIIVLFTITRISICLFLYVLTLILRKIQAGYNALASTISCMSRSSARHRIPYHYQALHHASSLEEYLKHASILDRLEGKEEWKMQRESRDYDYLMLEIQTASLVRYRAELDVRALCFTLQNVFYRSFAHINNELLYSACHVGTKFMIEEYYSRVVEQLSFICSHPPTKELSTRAKLRFFHRARRAYGKTALCLSGGGSLAMYHAGVAKAMVMGNCLPSVIAGTSGGSIIAGVLATHTDAELRDPSFLTDDISNRYHTRWLPRLSQQVRNFMRKRVLLDSKEFIHTCQLWYGDYTFEEAYKRTGRDVSITVSYASKTGSTFSSHALVLNHISSPAVLIWSAVTTSCALPGIMEPQTLMAKQHDGSVVPYYPHGTEWCDGTLQQDLPFQRLTELFNAQNFIVSQVNPHVTPFLTSTQRAPHLSLLTRIEQFLMADISHRLKRLAKMKVIPKIYGQDFSAIINGAQRYTGDVTIMPHMSFRMLFKALQHPSREDMQRYLKGGEQATWCRLSQVQHSQIIERTLEECVRVTNAKIRAEERRQAERIGREGEVAKQQRQTQQQREAMTRREAAQPQQQQNLDQTQQPGEEVEGLPNNTSTTNTSTSSSSAGTTAGSSSNNHHRSVSSLINTDGTVNMARDNAANSASPSPSPDISPPTSANNSPALSPLPVHGPSNSSTSDNGIGVVTVTRDESDASLTSDLADLDFDLDDSAILLTPISSPNRSYYLHHASPNSSNFTSRQSSSASSTARRGIFLKRTSSAGDL